jgi:hypothetical protein
MNHESQGLRLNVFVGVRVSQNGEELSRLGNHATTVRALGGQVDLGIRQGDVDVVPWAGLAVVVPVLVGPPLQSRAARRIPSPDPSLRRSLRGRLEFGFERSIEGELKGLMLYLTQWALTSGASSSRLHPHEY